MHCHANSLKQIWRRDKQHTSRRSVFRESLAMKELDKAPSVDA
jgi:hypothetical protein